MMWTKHQVIKCPFENSPNNANGDSFTENGTISYESGVFGKALSTMNGGHIRMGINYLGNLCEGASAIAFSCYFNKQSAAASVQVLLQPWLSGNSAFLLLYFDGNQIIWGGRSQASDSLATITGPTLSLNTNYHVCAIANYTEKTLKLYIDLELVAQATGVNFGSNVLVNSVDNRQDTLSGRFDRTEWDFQGKMDEAQLWRTKLPASDNKRLIHGLHPISI